MVWGLMDHNGFRSISMPTMLVFQFLVCRQQKCSWRRCIFHSKFNVQIWKKYWGTFSWTRNAPPPHHTHTDQPGKALRYILLKTTANFLFGRNWIISLFADESERKHYSLLCSLASSGYTCRSPWKCVKEPQMQLLEHRSTTSHIHLCSFGQNSAGVCVCVSVCV